MIRLAAILVLAALLAGPLIACGRKGPPEVPPGQTDILSQRHYPTHE